jgi:hypothetical protein
VGRTRLASSLFHANNFFKKYSKIKTKVNQGVTWSGRSNGTILTSVRMIFPGEILKMSYILRYPKIPRGIHYKNHPTHSIKIWKIWAAFEPGSEPFEFSSDRQDRSGFGARPAATRCVHASAVDLHCTRWRGRGDVLLSKFRCWTDELSWVELQTRQLSTATSNSCWQLVYQRA